MDVLDHVILHEFVPGSEEAVADFDLSLLGDVAQQCPVKGGDASSSGCSSSLIKIFPDFSTGVGCCISQSDSLSLRISAIEERLGIYHVAFWGVKVNNIISTFVTCCSDIFVWSVSVSEFTVVHRLDARRTGFLLVACVAVDFYLFVDFNVVVFIVNFVNLLLNHIFFLFQLPMFVHLRFHLSDLWGKLTT